MIPQVGLKSPKAQQENSADHEAADKGKMRIHTPTSVL
jgi:hypothetical protein